jgi:hypothetical protein
MESGIGEMRSEGRNSKWTTIHGHTARFLDPRRSVAQTGHQPPAKGKEFRAPTETVAGARVMDEVVLCGMMR